MKTKTSVPLVQIGPFRPKNKAKYHPDHQNAFEAIGPPQKWPFKGQDPSLCLPRKFKKSGWTFRCLDRSEQWGLYEKSKDCYPAGSTCTGWEVVKIRKRSKDKTLPSGSVLPKGQEYYPTSEDFGTYGFAHSTLESAMEKFLCLTGIGVHRD